MDDNVQNGLQAEQWLPTFEKGEKKASSLGSGALRFIRTRSSIRRELKRQCSRNKSGDSHMVHDGNNGSGGGGLGKWLRDHLGGGSRASHDISTPTSKPNENGVDSTGNEKPFGKTIYTSQNLYCSLPREHGRHSYNAARKTGHGGSLKPQGYDRQRSSSVNHQEKINLSELGNLTRGGPIYGSEGKTMRKRNRDRRRHSLNETHEQGRQRRRSNDQRARTYLDMASRVPENVKSEIYDANEEKETSDVEINYNFDDISFEGEGDEGEFYDREDFEEDEGRKIKDERLTEKELWKIAESRYEDERYEEEYEEEEEEAGEGEEEMPLSPTASEAEKLKEARQTEESELSEIPAEISADREAMIGRLRELMLEETELRRKNKMLELWVSRHLKKTEQKITPTDLSKTTEQMQEIYREALRTYKLHVDEIMTQQAALMFEVQSYSDKVRMAREVDEDVFNEFLNREREIAVGLVYATTGRKITEKIMNDMTYRQISRREILARDRRKYIFLQHRLEDLHSRLQNLETLGEGMTTMDYEALRIINISYKDKLDERDQELEKLRLKIAELVNGVTHYKEKEACLAADIVHEEEELQDYREKAAGVREEVYKFHLILKDLRDTTNEKKFAAGFLTAQQELLEMERTMKARDALKDDIEMIEHEIRQYAPPNVKKKK